MAHHAQTERDKNIYGDSKKTKLAIIGEYVAPTANTRPSSREFDPDQESIQDVLSRLDSYTQNWPSEGPFACTSCECQHEDQSEVMSRTVSRAHGSEEEEDSSDDEGNICTSFGNILNVLTSSVLPVQEACLILMKQICNHQIHVDFFVQNHILDFLYKTLVVEVCSPIHRASLSLLEMIFSIPHLKSLWIEISLAKIFPLLLRMIRNAGGQLDVKYAACCVFRTLSACDEFIPVVMEDVLPAILQLRSASAKFREVYVEILTNLVSHTDCIPPDLLDSSAVPVAISIIREGPCGPQCAALRLLSRLASSDPGVATVIGSMQLVPKVLCCLKESQCRKVRAQALDVMRPLTQSRRLGLCKDLMLQVSSYFIAPLDHDSLTILYQGSSTMKARFEEEKRMWRGFEHFIDFVINILDKEGRVQRDEKGRVEKVCLTPCIDVCPRQFGQLSNAIQIIQNVCLWPLDRSKLGFSANKINIASFTDDQKQRSRLSKVNRSLAQVMWDKCGEVFVELLLAYSTKFLDVVQHKSFPTQICVSHIFEPVEIDLIVKLLDVLLCFAVCTCTEFPEVPPQPDKIPTQKSKQNHLKSASTPTMWSVDASAAKASVLTSSSSTEFGTNLEGVPRSEERIWVNENPHLTASIRRQNASPGEQDIIAKHHLDLQQKEANTERRLLRKCLFESGIVHTICSFQLAEDKEIQVLIHQILRCMIQPLGENIPQPTSNQPKLSKTRPQSAMCSQDIDKRLNMALEKMSPGIAELIKEALGPRPKTAVAKLRPSADVPVVLDTFTIKEEPEDGENENCNNSSLCSNRKLSPRRKPRPMFDRRRTIADQCRDEVLVEAGGALLQGLFVKAKELRKQSALLLHDLVHHGETDVHMKLSELGCMPKLVDYLRVNEEDELMEIIGLVIVQMLVSSDPRLKQLFNRYGGPGLLMAMSQYTTGLLKKEVARTLHSVTKGTIQQRWTHEDKVADVLRQWWK
ncbi:hypothetical protein ACJMK2_028838 [Sinanodonta woodiana]|uniref:Uncharacterized protein n=1 Tax=Sinanodonta woodiana TaxID=1069815 RepID=A0ABD3X8D4_SINWO